MSDNNQNSDLPDRAASTDDGLDVPAYRKDPAQDSTTQFPQGASGAYQRTGRAAPQEIPAEPKPAPYSDQDFAPTGSHETVAFGYGSTPGPAPTAAPVAAPAFDNTDPAADLAEPKVFDHRRGTIDLGLLIIRLLLGVWLILESVGTFFQLGGSEGISGLEADYANYLAPSALAIAVPAMQLAAGVFLVLGLITPLFAMIATVATSFTALDALAGSGAGLNIFAWSEGVWLSLVLLGVSVALQFTGPGLYSFDYGRSWARRPLFSSWIFVVLAISGGVALWWFGAGINPLN
ncbi:DoxX family protein [Corynebacterium alimapuense]|uniref:DoxX family protein n=1 Tax=Corynebacterium alimapuense TaxID=1576874 RepID=A0A3M8K762_9CORY|nr:DoxX family protein [Corynebacterium alimapuense]RNE48354.1 DoxX family protein [Corynebacterium alimapuense]